MLHWLDCKGRQSVQVTATLLAELPVCSQIHACTNVYDFLWQYSMIFYDILCFRDSVSPFGRIS